MKSRIIIKDGTNVLGLITRDENGNYYFTVNGIDRIQLHTLENIAELLRKLNKSHEANERRICGLYGETPKPTGIPDQNDLPPL
jgi:hypothetical protein